MFPLFSRTGYRKRVAALALILLAATAAAATIAKLKRPPARPAPIICDAVGDKVILGAVHAGAVISREVRIKNPAGVPVLVGRVVTSCGCTRASLSSVVIAPRSSALLSLRIAVHRWPGPGVVNVALIGKCGKEHWHRTLVVSYYVHRMLRIAAGGREQLTTEGFIRLGTLPSSTRALPPLTILRGGYPEKWERLQCDAIDGILTARLDKLSASHWGLVLARRHPFYYGSQSCMLRFSFIRGGRALRYRLYDPVTFRVVGPAELVPDSVFFGEARAGKVLAERVGLWVASKRNGRAYRITAAAASDPVHLRTRITPGGRAVRLSLNTADLAGRVQGHVVITVSRAGKTYRFREDYLGYVMRHATRR